MINLIKNKRGKMRCQNCSWSWGIEKDDTQPFLCHKCGYDDELGDFDMDSLQKWEKENNYPFDEYVEEGYHIRTFSESTNDKELVWHRDREDRIVESIGYTDWLIQLDNELPKPLTERIYISKEVYHRVIKGNGDLKVKVKKIYD
jgi:Zn ribbon nucleic-acid-binding protein